MSLEQLVRTTMGSGESDRLSQIAEHLLPSLGWETDIRRSRNVGEFVSAQAAGEPQLFVGLGGVGQEAALLSAAYSHEATWAVLMVSGTVSLHRTGSWNVSPGDSPVVAASLSAPSRVAQIFGALDRRVYNSLDLPTNGAPARRPLAEHLALAFANMRKALLESNGRTEDVDEGFRLFHQLLFARLHEDRFEAVGGQRIDEAWAAADGIAQLQQLLDRYARTFNSELFEGVPVIADMPRDALTDLMRELTEPWRELELDFSVTENDFAGRLYQSYLRLAPAKVEAGRLFSVVEFENHMDQQAAFYTPRALADFVVSKTLRPWLAANQPTLPEQVRILDPACGSGAFLVAAYRELLLYFSVVRDRELTPEERNDVLTASIFGVDLDKEAVALARVQLLENADLPPAKLPSLGGNILEGDSLSMWIIDSAVGGVNAWRKLGTFDVVIFNPPFQAPRQSSATGQTSEVVKKAFSALAGTGANYAFAFMQLAWNLLSPKGAMGMIAPRTLLDGPAGEAARAVVGHASISEVFDFGRCRVFGETMVYVAAVVAQRDGLGDDQSLVRIRDRGLLPMDVLEALRTASRDGTDQSLGSAEIFRVTRSASEVDGGPDTWSPFAVRLSKLLKDQSATQWTYTGRADAPRVVIGTQTGNDKKFVFDASNVEHRRPGLALVGGFELSSEHVRPWVCGKDIGPFVASSDKRFVVVPSLGISTSLDEFVASRGGVPKSKRAGDLVALDQPKVLFKNLFNEPAAVADTEGTWLMPQGGSGVCALVPAVLGPMGDLRLLEALLNSAFYQWLFQGVAHTVSQGFAQMMKHHWELVPWPAELDPRKADRVLSASEALRNLLTQGAVEVEPWWTARTEVDNSVDELLGLTATMRETVRSELWRLP